MNNINSKSVAIKLPSGNNVILNISLVTLQFPFELCNQMQLLHYHNRIRHDKPSNCPDPLSAPESQLLHFKNHCANATAAAGVMIALPPTQRTHTNIPTRSFHSNTHFRILSTIIPVWYGTNSLESLLTMHPLHNHRRTASTAKAPAGMQPPTPPSASTQDDILMFLHQVV